MSLEIDMPERPLLWLLYFPIGLLALSIISLLVFVTWPLYVIHRIGKWVVFMAGDLP